jgi:pyruvate/2-oxoglutarate dehydrogenase complex dihydrolipoamide acyltransferase (E2) component
MTEIRVPKFGMSAVDAEILEILVAPGDQVVEGQPVVEAGSDKVDFTIESETAGTVAEVRVAVGDICPMGSVIMTLS